MIIFKLLFWSLIRSLFLHVKYSCRNQPLIFLYLAIFFVNCTVIFKTESFTYIQYFNKIAETQGRQRVNGWGQILKVRGVINFANNKSFLEING